MAEAIPTLNLGRTYLTVLTIKNTSLDVFYLRCSHALSETVCLPEVVYTIFIVDQERSAPTSSEIDL